MGSQADLEGATVLVTGGVRGVGAGITRAFERAGATVVACARHEVDKAQEGVDFIRCDVRDPAAVDDMISKIADRHGHLDVVVNNAGGSPFGSLADGELRRHLKIIELNLLAPLIVSRAANRCMQEQLTGGSIIMIGSVSGRRPSPGTAAYGAAKAGLVNLAATLAVEWAPKVRVNTVTVGPVRTELAHLHYGDDDGLAAVARTIPAGRLAETDDVGSACVFLASPQAEYISGADLLLHGGGERPAFLDAATVNKEQ